MLRSSALTSPRRSFVPHSASEWADPAGNSYVPLIRAIDSTNDRSIQFHAELGFVEVARMSGIGEKWGQRLDLVLMQVDLGQRPK
jgi:L-amino acid N-acyltransferase YncA